MCFQVSKSRGASDRKAPNKALTRTQRGTGIRGRRVSGRSFGGFAESGFIRITAPVLDAALADVPDPRTRLMFVSDAGHGVPPLALCGGTGQNTIGLRRGSLRALD